MTDRQLDPCPSSPNCVSSQARADDAEHHVAPIAIPAGTTDVIGHVVRTLEGSKRTRIVERDEHYVHAVVTSALLRFKDDVEFLYDPEAHRLDVRSASRVGHSDLGVNRKRVETLRAALEA